MLCPNIEHNLSWRVNGQLSPCNNIVNFPIFLKLEDMYSSDIYKNLLQNNRDNIKSNYCTRCWDKEKIGLKSKRQDDQQLDLVYKKINKDYLKIDSALGHVCNAACVICGPDSSSLWQKYIPIAKRENNSEIWNICNNNLEKLIQIDFGGGEPWLNEIEQQENLLDNLIKSGQSKKVKVRYNTNGSLYPKKLLDKLKNFRQVEITLSIDDIEDRFEYNRWPLKWSNVLTNLTKLKQLNEKYSHIILTINYTVSVFTWLRANNFLTWAKQFNMESVNFNILTEPKLYSIKNISIRENLPDTIFNRIIASEPMENWLEQFTEKMEKLDKERKTKWQNVFPELKALL